MEANFEASLANVLQHEGGYVNHPKDPGGATNRGITHRTYDAWRSRQGLPDADVRNITEAEVAAIYRVQYWNVIKGDDLPSGLDYAVFDFAVNSGPARAAKFLQRILGVPDDGIIGAVTLQAVAAQWDTVSIIERLCSARLRWLRTLGHWGTFGKGWTRRVGDVQGHATMMAAYGGAQEPSPGAVPIRPAQGKAPDPAPPSNGIPAGVGVGGIASAAGGVFAGVSQLDPMVQLALVVGLVLLAVAGLWMWRNARVAAQ